MTTPPDAAPSERGLKRLKSILGEDWIFCSMAIMGILLFVIGTSRSGIGIMTDSIYYTSCAKNIIDGDGFEMFNGDIYHEYPPFLPLVLSVPYYLGLSVTAFAWAMNLVLYIAMIYLVSKILGYATTNRFVIAAGMFLTLASRPLFGVASILLSELMFDLFVVLSLFFLYKFLESGKNLHFILLIIFTSLSTLTRYLGIALIISVCLVLLFNPGAVRFKKRMRNIFLFGFFSSVPIAVFLIRNLNLTGTLTGPRYGSRTTFIENALTAYVDATHWFLPESFPLIIWIPLSLFVFGIVFLLIVNAALMIFRGNKRKNILISFSSFALVYTIYLFLTATLIGFDKLNDRFFSPIYIPFLIVILLSVDELILGNILRDRFVLTRSKSKTISRSFSSFVVVWIIGSSAVMVQDLNHDIEKGPGTYNGSEWTDSEILGYMRNNPPPGTVFTNFPEQVYYFAGIEDSHYAPLRYIQGSSHETYELETFGEVLNRTREAYLVWITISVRDFVHNVTEIDDRYQLILLREFKDGSIYLIDL